YLFQLFPNDMEMIMYYKYETTGSTTKTQTSYSFVMGSGNAHIGQYQYQRSNEFNAIGYNSNTGDAKLYTQAMGGPSIGVKIPESTIDDIREKIISKKGGIISAKIRIYTDPSWNNKNYAKPREFTLLRRYVNPDNPSAPTKVRANFTNDLLKLAGVPGYTIFKAYNLDDNPAYYDFVVTQSIKEMVEEGSKDSTDKTKFKYFKIDLGSFLENSDRTGLAGYKFTSTPFNTSRAVFVGTDTVNNPKQSVQLWVTYGTK
ncbi:DUF4270 family protein, partial [Flavobacterium sp. B17]|uniref:DUF4270 family protein n=1 Tax=Flavobacterium sp. B17 TaxID=95618 RepID=UPI0005B2E019